MNSSVKMTLIYRFEMEMEQKNSETFFLFERN